MCRLALFPVKHDTPCKNCYRRNCYLTSTIIRVTRNHVGDDLNIRRPVMKQNITLAIDKDLLKKVKVLAAQRDTSVTNLIAKQLERIVSEEDHYGSSKRRALARLKKGYHLGGRILAQREKLHERR